MAKYAPVEAGLRPAQARRKPQRLKEFDYATPGAYFVTICSQDRLPVLGNIVGDEVQVSRVGEIVKTFWHDLPNHYASIELDEFIVMSNHVHAIVWILDSSTQLSPVVGEGLRPSPTKPSNNPSLPEIIRAFKSYSARGVNKTCNTSGNPLWQRGYYEHIIRNDEDLYQHRSYVANNPLKWSADEYYR